MPRGSSGSRRGRRAWQRDDDPATARLALGLGDRFDPDFPAMHGADAARAREAEPDPSRWLPPAAGRVRRVTPVERREHTLSILRRDPVTVIHDGERDRVAVATHRELDRWRAVLRGVLDEIP